MSERAEDRIFAVGELSILNKIERRELVTGADRAQNFRRKNRRHTWTALDTSAIKLGIDKDRSRIIKASAAFRELWERHDVAVMRASNKTFVHPSLGEIALDCEVLLSVSGEQSLVLYTARPGTDSAGKLELLRVLGREEFADASNAG